MKNNKDEQDKILILEALNKEEDWVKASTLARRTGLSVQKVSAILNAAVKSDSNVEKRSIDYGTRDHTSVFRRFTVLNPLKGTLWEKAHQAFPVSRGMKR